MNNYELTARILLEIYKAIDFQRVPLRLKMKFWSWFENRIKSASLTTSLPKFLENISKISHLEISSGIFDLLNMCKNEDEILDILRSETKYVVLYMRDIKEKK